MYQELKDFFFFFNFNFRFAALKLPNLRWSDQSDGTAYLYMDPKTPHWTYLKGITTEQSAVGHTVAQMYAPTAAYNDVIYKKFKSGLH